MDMDRGRGRGRVRDRKGGCIVQGGGNHALFSMLCSSFLLNTLSTT